MSTYYGDPNEPLSNVMYESGGFADQNPPEVGDELCDGHQAHYTWNGTDWGCGPVSRDLVEGEGDPEK